MNKVKELKIDNNLWATPAKLVNLIDFEPKKISIETENDKLIKTITHQVRYENGGFYLTIDNFKGYFGFIDNSATNVVLNMIFSNDDIPTDEIIKISSVTIVIKSLIEKNNKFYLELALNHLSYQTIKK